jgi:putative transposase
MNIEISVSEVVNLIKELQKNPSRIFEMIGMNIQEDVGRYLTGLMKAELTHVLGREEYERKEGETNHRNGSYPRLFCIKGIGNVNVKVPRDRNGEYQTQVLPKGRQYEQRIVEDLSLMYLSGISTRTLSMLSKRLIGRKVSHEEVSEANRELTEAVEQWRSRDLSEEDFKYLYIDGVNFKMRSGRKVEGIPVLVAIGVTEEGIKLVVGLQRGDKESAGSWREFFRDLKQRGLMTCPNSLYHV